MDEITDKDIEEFKARIGPEAENMSDAELRRSKYLIRTLAGVLFDMWIRQRLKDSENFEDTV